MGERREEENGRRGYGKRAGTSCEVRAARHEIVSFAIDRAKKGRRTSAGEGLTTSLTVARPAAEKPHHADRIGIPCLIVRRHLSSDRSSVCFSPRRFKKALAGPRLADRSGLAERGKHDLVTGAYATSACRLLIGIHPISFSRVAKRRRRDRVAARSPSVRFSACDDD